MTNLIASPSLTDTHGDADAIERDYFNAWRLRFTKDEGRMPGDVDIWREARRYGESLRHGSAVDHQPEVHRTSGIDSILTNRADAMVSIAVVPTVNLAKPGDWVCDGRRVAKVQEAHQPTGEAHSYAAYDLVLYERSGKRLGRETPAEGGPRGYEPFCSAELWYEIDKPRFLIMRLGALDFPRKGNLATKESQ